MEKLRHLGALILIGAWMMMGCGDDDSTPPDQTVTLELVVMSFEPGVDQAPVPNAEVCLLGTADCVTSDEDGMVSLQIPANADSALTITASGFNPTLSPQVAESSDITGRAAVVLSEGVAEALATILGLSYPLTDTGVIALTALTVPVSDPNNGIPGITYTLTEPQGAHYYLNENGIPQTTLDATTAPLGAGGFIELTEGVYEIALGGTASNCIRVAAWAGSSANNITLPIEPGFFTDAYISCDPVVAP